MKKKSLNDKKKLKNEKSYSGAYEKGEVNSILYSSWRTKFDDLFESEKRFLNADIIKSGDCILDIGGAVGGAGKAIKDSIESNIDYTVLDPDEKCIKIGKKLFPEFKYISGYFPDDCKNKKYDLVLMLALFPQLPDWKKTIIDMCSFSKKYINFSLLTKLIGPTVVDKDISYFYYLDSGERVHQVVNNLKELINFCSIQELRVKKINFYGYHTKNKGNNNRCVSNDEIIKGNMLLELFGQNEDCGIRFGGSNRETFEKKRY